MTEIPFTDKKETTEIDDDSELQTRGSSNDSKQAPKEFVESETTDEDKGLYQKHGAALIFGIIVVFFLVACCIYVFLLITCCICKCTEALKIKNKNADAKNNEKKE